MENQNAMVVVKPVTQPKKPDDLKLLPHDLVDYLFTPGVEVGSDAFPKTFDFTQHSHHLKELYDNTRTDFVYDKKEREEGETVLDGGGIPDKELAEILKQHYDNLFSVKAHVERGRVLYYDTNVGKVGITDIDYGKFAEVVLPFHELFLQRKMPGLYIHTHPNTQMPSPFDYGEMLIDLGDGKTRAIKATMVLCPDIQILALATDKTPLLSMEKADEYIFQNSKKLNDYYEKGADILAKAVGKTITKPLEIYKKQQDEIISNLQQFADGKITEDEFNQRVDDIKGKFSEELSSQGTSTIGRVSTKVHEVLNRYANAVLIGFARETNMKLYSSTDMKTFAEFSA